MKLVMVVCTCVYIYTVHVHVIVHNDVDDAPMCTIVCCLVVSVAQLVCVHICDDM